MDIPRHARRLLPAAIACTTIGCFGSSNESCVGTTGELGQGRFQHVCQPSDAFCQAFGVAGLPQTVARGSRLDPLFDGGEDGAFVVEPVAPRIASIEEGSIVFHEAGDVALIARQRDKVGDFLHVRVAAIADLDLTMFSSITPGTNADAEIQVGQQQFLEVVPVDASGAILGGALTYEWTSLDAAVVQMVADPLDNTARANGVAAGTTTIRVTTAEAVGELTVEVLP